MSVQKSLKRKRAFDLVAKKANEIGSKDLFSRAVEEWQKDRESDRWQDLTQVFRSPR